MFESSCLNFASCSFNLYFSISSAVSPDPPIVTDFVPLPDLISTSTNSCLIKLPWKIEPSLPKVGAPPLYINDLAYFNHANSI